MPWNHVPTLDQLEALVLAADAGSIGKAAAGLHVSQQTLSARIAAAERTLGLTILVRSSQGVRPTTQGAEILGDIRRLVVAVGRLDDHAGHLRNPRRLLRVASSNTITEALLPTWVAQLRGRFPDLDVRTLPGNSADVVSHVLAGRADIGFIESPSAPTGVRVLPVAPDRLVVLVPPDHPWAHPGTELTRSLVEETPLILRETGSGTRELIDLSLPHLPEPVQTVGSSAFARAACRTLAVPTILSELACADDVAAGRLVPVHVIDLEMVRMLRAVVPLKGRLAPMAQELASIAARQHS